jgi:hypothetical protein
MSKKEEALYNKIKSYTVVNPQTLCWETTRFVDKDGYGRFKIARKSVSIGRAMLLCISGITNTKMLALHKCDNGLCANPDHLFWGTVTDNMRDMAKKGRHFYQKDKNNIRKGELVGTSKLTKTEAITIFKMANSNKYTLTQIALKFNTSVANVSLIKLKKNWRHIHI